MSDLPDTIYSPEQFMSSLPIGFDGVFDWSWTANCWDNPRDKPMDIDMFKERKGHFLVVETKKVGADIPLGQKIAFERLHKLGVFTIMFIWGKPQPEFAEAWYPTGETVQLEGVDQITDFVRRWYRYAEDNPFPRESK